MSDEYQRGDCARQVHRCIAKTPRVHCEFMVKSYYESQNYS